MTEVITASDDAIKKAAEYLREGGVVISPTDSVYGIFCDATNEEAVSRIYSIKGRDDSKPLQVAVLKRDAGKYAVLSREAEKIVEHFWPGDVNIVVQKRGLIPDFVCGETVCLTCHRNRVASRLAELSHKPLISTSANLSGRPPATWAGELAELLVNDVDMVLDGGATHNRRPNTILDLTAKPVRVLRQGHVSEEEINKIL